MAEIINPFAVLFGVTCLVGGIVLVFMRGKIVELDEEMVSLRRKNANLTDEILRHDERLNCIAKKLKVKTSAGCEDTLKSILSEIERHKSINRKMLDIARDIQPGKYVRIIE